MKRQLRFLTLLATLALAAAPAHAQLTACNVRAAQRAGTKLVDIDYDITGIATPVFVALEISADGGTTWTVPATTLTGAIGTNVTPGTDLRITWDAGADWNNQTSSQTRFRLRVSDLLPEQVDFALIPGGTFTMGDSLDGMTDAPPHTVNVSAFYMQKKETTKAEWDAVRSWGMLNGYTDLAVGSQMGAGHPVQTVSWYSVVKWCNARSEKEGLTPCYYTDAAQTVVFKRGSNNIDNTMVKWSANGYRLPTEAEWEKAARGGLGGKRYPLGDSITQADANYGASGTVAVGSYAPNGYGLYDMAGNLWELCWDWYGTYPTALETDPHGPSGSTRVLRGGFWGHYAGNCRVALRAYDGSPGNLDDNFDFRSVRSDVSFALIPGGSFTMGDSLDGLSDALPHTVNVSTFYMQKTEVTKAEWDVVRDWGSTHGYADLAGGVGPAAEHPVQTVSWYDVVKWCNARSEKDGLTPCYYTDAAQTAVYRTGNTDIDNTMVKWTSNGYRLPTEAEWEKAARGGLSGKRFPWGDSIMPADANYSSGGTVVVGSYAPNGYGLYDTAGNVYEWCWDWYNSNYYNISPTADPLGPAAGPRVLRGGGWGAPVDYCRVAFRSNFSPWGTTLYGFGFRTARANLVTADSPNIAVNTKDPILTIIALHGTVPGAGQYEMNTTVELTPTPDLGYLFSKWTGDATGSGIPLSVLLDSAKTINAIFVQDSRDPDGDGLTNYQELVVYHSNPNVADTDEDGFSDGYEVNSGYSPTDPNSTPETSLVIYTAVEIRFGAAQGQSYRVESSMDLQTWTMVEEHITGTGGTVARLYSIQEIPKRYFRSVRE
ncbi:MAG: SUMF1/EgtB/PvdO family nonheme iron enzyme [Verrucomicrobia bacterium]|nr:SUMF1/EgtB/PvdO family nonheme iron enzyme [Verrucomicrobiota bacterium]